MFHAGSPRRRLLSAALVSLLAVSAAQAEESNRDQVRATLERDGWSVVWGKNFTEADWLRGTKAIAESIATENPGPFLIWFSQTLDENFAKIQRNFEDISRRDLERWVLQSLKQKQVITYRGFQIEAGFATYDRWERIVYDEPRTRSISRPPFFETFTVRVERRSNLPNWHQFYIRYRLTGNQGGRPSGGPGVGPGSRSVVEVSYTIRNDSGRVVRFHMQPSGRSYSLDPGRTFRGTSHRVDGRPPTITLDDSGRTYRLTEGDHRFWWMSRQRRVGFDRETD